MTHTHTATFLATYAAGRYTDLCARGRHEELKNQPVEDAMLLAESAWVKYAEITGKKG